MEKEISVQVWMHAIGDIGLLGCGPNNQPVKGVTRSWTCPNMWGSMGTNLNTIGSCWQVLLKIQVRFKLKDEINSYHDRVSYFLPGLYEN